MQKEIIVLMGLTMLSATLLISASPDQNMNGMDIATLNNTTLNNITLNLTQNMTLENQVSLALINATLSEETNQSSKTPNEKLMNLSPKSGYILMNNSAANASANVSINEIANVMPLVTTNTTTNIINDGTEAIAKTSPQSKIFPARIGADQKKIFMLGKTWERQPFEITQKVKPPIDIKKWFFVSDNF
jgi:hypothetical protein